MFSALRLPLLTVMVCVLSAPAYAQTIPPVLPFLPELAGVAVGVSAPAKTGCVGTAAGVQAIILCDEVPHTLAGQTNLDVVRVAYGTSLTASGFDIVALRNSAGQTGATSDYFSPISVFSDTENFFGPALATFTNTTVHAPTDSLAMVTASTGGVLTLGPGFVLTQNPGLGAGVSQSGLSSFGGGRIAADGVTIDMTLGVGTALQVTNTASGGGLPSTDALGSLSITNSTIAVGNSSVDGRWSRGALVLGEAELRMSNTTITGGTRAIGIFNVWGSTSTGLISGSRSFLDRVDVTLGDIGVGLWARGDHARIEANDTRISAGQGSFGAALEDRAVMILTDTDISVGASSAGIGIEDNGVLTMVGGSIVAPAADSSGLELDVLMSPTAATLSGTRVQTAGRAIRVADSQTAVELNNGAFVLGNTALLDVTNSQFILSASGGSTLLGNAFADAASVANMNLMAGSRWIGAAFDVTNVTIDSTSIWTMTASSVVTQQIMNAGLIDFTPPGAGGFKTLSVAHLQGQGGIIGLHTFLGTDGSPSDRVVITSPDTAAGNSRLRITNAGGPGALTVANGILVVDTVNDGTTQPTAFTLARPVVGGPYEYTLHRSAVDGSNPEAWYLRSNIDCSGSNPPIPPCPAPPVPPVPPGPGPGPGPGPTPPVPNIRPEVSLYTALPAMALFYGRTLLDTLHERVGEQEQLRAFANPGASPYANGAWGRIIAQHAERDSNSQGIFGTAGPQYDVDFTALQAGLDVYRRQEEDGSRNHAGLYGAFGRGDGDVTHLARIGAGTDTFDAWSVGGYWTWYAPMGAYIDTVLQGTWYDMTADPRRLPASDTDGFAVAASVEGGYPLQLGGGWVAEPQAQAIWQSLDLDETRDIGATIRFEDETSLAARIGLRLAKSWTAFAESGQPAFITAWFRPNLWYEFEGEPKTLFSSATGFIPFRADIGGSWLELNAGVSARVDAMVSLYANAGYDIGLSADGDAYNGKLGIRVNW